jgi:preprotein translocase subunit SecG
MFTIVLVIHVLISISLVGLVLLQRSEGGALGIGGGGGGGGVMSGRSASNILTKGTAALAVAFMATSILLAILSGVGGSSRSILDDPAPVVETAPPDEPTEPTVPAR